MKSEIRNLKFLPLSTAWIWLLVVPLVYIRCLGGEFLNWDDLDWIVTNPVVLGAEPLSSAWTGTVHHAYYPLYTTALRGLWAVGGSALPFHVASLVGFAAAAVLWHLCLGRLGIGATARWLGVALFALHPLRVETVAWASALRDVMSLDLVLAALLLHLAPSRARWAAAPLFGAALLCKTTVFALAPIPLLIDLLWRQRPWRSSAAAAAPMIALGLAGAWITWLAYRPVAELNHYTHGGLLGSLPSLASIQLRYLRLQIWPHDLAALPSAPAAGVAGWIVLGFGLLAVILAVAWAVRGRRGPILLVAAYTLPMLPVCGLLPLSWPVADRYTLIPSLAVTAALAWAADRLVARGGRGPLLAALTAALAGLLVVTTQLQIPVWHDSVSLWQSSLERFPREFAAHQNYAAAVGEAGDMDEAAHHLTLAIELADGREPQTRRLVQLLLFAELLRMNVPMEQTQGFLNRYGSCGNDPVALAGLALDLGGARLGPPSEVLVRRAADLGAPEHLLWLARSTAAAREGRWWQSLGHAQRGLRHAPSDGQLRSLEVLALYQLGGRAAAAPAAQDLAREIPGLEASTVLDEMERRGGS